METGYILDLPLEEIIPILEAMDYRTITSLCAISSEYKALCEIPVIAKMIRRKSKEDIQLRLRRIRGDLSTNLSFDTQNHLVSEGVGLDFTMVPGVAQEISSKLMDLGGDEELGEDIFLAQGTRRFKIEGESDRYVTLLSLDSRDVPGVYIEVAFKTKPFARMMSEYAGLERRDEVGTIVLRGDRSIEIRH